MSRTAIIVGSAGQDGTLLQSFLSRRNYRLVGIDREGTYSTESAFDHLPFDIRDAAAVAVIVRDVKPDEIYYLAAYHHSSQDRTDDDARPRASTSRPLAFSMRLRLTCSARPMNRSRTRGRRSVH